MGAQFRCMGANFRKAYMTCKFNIKIPNARMSHRSATRNINQGTAVLQFSGALAQPVYLLEL